MFEGLEDARKLAHGTYDDVIVVEHRQRTGASPLGASGGSQAALPAPLVVLEMPEGSRVIDMADRYEIDGVTSSTPPRVGASYRVIVAPSQSASGEATSGGSLIYQTRFG